MVDNLVAMVAMHYVSDREDTPMWADQQVAPRPELLNELIEIMSHRGPQQQDIPTTGYELFGANHFWFVGQGQGLINADGCRQELIAYGSRKIVETHLRKLQSSKQEPTQSHRMLLEQIFHQVLGGKLEWKLNQFDLKDMKRLDG